MDFVASTCSDNENCYSIIIKIGIYEFILHFKVNKKRIKLLGNNFKNTEFKIDSLDSQKRLFINDIYIHKDHILCKRIYQIYAGIDEMTGNFIYNDVTYNEVINFPDVLSLVVREIKSRISHG